MGRELSAAVLKLRYRRFTGGGVCYRMERDFHWEVWGGM